MDAGGSARFNCSSSGGIIRIEVVRYRLGEWPNPHPSRVEQRKGNRRKERRLNEPGSDAPCSGSVSPGLAKGVLYFGDSDWVFASIKAKGRIPRTASICAQDYLRPAAIKAGVITKVTKADLDGTIAAIASQAFAVLTKSIQPSLSQSCGTRNCRRRWRFTLITLILCRWPRRRNSSKQLVDPTNWEYAIVLCRRSEAASRGHCSCPTAKL